MFSEDIKHIEAKSPYASILSILLSMQVLSESTHRHCGNSPMTWRSFSALKTCVFISYKVLSSTDF